MKIAFVVKISFLVVHVIRVTRGLASVVITPILPFKIKGEAVAWWQGAGQPRDFLVWQC